MSIHPDPDSPYHHPAIAQWCDHLAKSFCHWRKEPLIVPREGTSLAEAMFYAPQVIVSHGIQPDPIFNYANRSALNLWEMDWQTFTRLPSRLSAEPMHRDERSRMLAQLSRQGYVDNYGGVRISSQGRRFFIEQAIIWNVLDEQGSFVGQAASFQKWTFLQAADCKPL